MRTPVRTLLLLGAVAGAAVPAGAEEIAGLTVHGFISQGYIRTTENELYFGHTTDGNFEFNEAALSFSTEPIPRLRVGMQLFAQDLGSLGNHRVIVDWAVGDYRFNDAFGVRGGKLKLPLGLYGTLRDADLGRPEILQPEAIYSDNLKDLVRAFNGASVYGTFELGGAGYLDYEAFGGAVSTDDTAVGKRIANIPVAAFAAALSSSGLRQVRATAEPVDATMKYMYGGALEYRPPVQGLRLRFSGWTHDSELTSRATITGYLGPIPATFLLDSTFAVKHEPWVIASAEYQRGGLRISAERSWETLSVQPTTTGLPTGTVVAPASETKPGGWYVQVAQRLNERVQLSAYYSRYFGNRDIEDRSALDAYMGWDKDLAFSGRLDLANHFLLKAEFHRVDGGTRASVIENPEGVARKWNVFAAKGTVHF
jgi:hypothetical protein